LTQELDRDDDPTANQEIPDDAPLAPALLLARKSQERHANAHQEEKARRAKVSDEACEEGESVCVDRIRPAPHLARRVFVSDKEAGMV
jgi:hypothetical protein